MATTVIQNNDPASEINAKPPTGGIINGVQAGTAAPAAAIATSDDINSAYNSLFGRPAEAAGMDFWKHAVDVGGWSPDQLKQQIAKSAQKKDIAAAQSLNGQGDLSKNWSQTGLSTDKLNTSVHWDPKTNQWTNGDVPQAATYQPALLGNPTKWEITPEQTVQGQMKNLIDPNNPYYQQWQTAGLAAAAGRGLQNSSIAQTGILDSVMRGATPIATSDAGTYAKAAGYNADESNVFAQANQNAMNTAGAFNAGQKNSLASQIYGADKSAQTQLSVTDKNNATALAQSGISAETQKIIAQMNNQSQAAVSAAHDANSNLIQSNQQAQTAYNSYVAAVAQIDQNKDMDANAKATAIARQTQIFNSAISGLKAQIKSTSDIGSPLDISGVNTAAQQVNGVDVSNLLNFA